MNNLKFLTASLVLALGLQGIALAQTTGATTKSSSHPAMPKRAAATAKTAPAPKVRKLDPRQQFVMDVVKSAVALPQPDPQDRLRVLSTAVSVISPLNRSLAKSYASEGMRIEKDLIQAGETPVASMLDGGEVDCNQVTSFVENVPTARISAAEQSLVGALSLCPSQAAEPLKQKIQTAMDEGHIAPRALLALVDRNGASDPWSRDQFLKMFSNLPADANASAAEGPNYAAMYSRMAPELDKDAAKTSGVKLLLWLGKLEESGERNLSVNIATGAMKEALGEKGYEDALASDVMASQVAQTAGKEGEIEHPEEESVSVLHAMGTAKIDRSAELADMPPSLQAREAAASGFATGTSGDRKMAGRYFDIAFSALDKVWDDRSSTKDAPAVVQEVSEAAAQVDPVDALKRAQQLSDKTAQAIGMIAVARVASSQQGPEPVAQK